MKIIPACRIVLCSLAVTVAVHAQIAQKWVRHYQGPLDSLVLSRSLAASVAVDPAGDVIVTGPSDLGPLESNGYVSNGADYATIKYRGTTGEKLWEVIYNGPGNADDIPHCVKVNSLGDVFVTGASTNAAGNTDCYTVKYSGANGSVLWERRFNGAQNGPDVGLSLAVDHQDNVVVVGYTHNSSAVNPDYYIVKYSGSGSMGGAGLGYLWQATYDGPEHLRDLAFGVAVDGSNNVFVTGGSQGPYPSSGLDNYDFLTLKYSSSGDFRWGKRTNGPAGTTDIALALVVDPDGDVIVTGESHNPSDYDYLTEKYDKTSGATLWSRTYASAAGDDIPAGIAVDAVGNVAVTGTASGIVQGESDYYTAKYAASDGAVLWSARYNGPFNYSDGASGVAMDSEGNVTVTGMASVLHGASLNLDIATVSYASLTGAVVWEKRFNGPENLSDGMDTLLNGGKIALTPDGGVVVAGHSSTYSSFSEFTTLKYGPAVPEIEVVSPSTTVLLDNGPARDFGQVRVGTDSVAQVFTVRNTGDDTLTGINVSRTSGDPDFQLQIDNVTPTLAPGASFTFEVKLHPTSVGTKTATLQVTSNDADENPYDIHLTGVGFIAPEIVVEDEFNNDLAINSNHYDYPNPVESGQSGTPVVLTIRNTGNDVLMIGALSLGGSDPELFSIDYTSLDHTLNPGEFTTFTLTFSPTAPGYGYTSLVIPNNDPDEDPYTIEISGYSPVPLPPYEVTKPGGEGPVTLTDGESHIDFGNVTLSSTSASLVFTVANTGAQDLSDMSVMIESGEGGSAGDFTLTTDPIPNPLTPAGSFTFTLTFHPSAVGLRYATLRVKVGAEDPNSFDLPLGGTGVTPPYLDYDTWAMNANLEGDDALPNADPYGDGVANLLKYAFNMNGSVPDRAILESGTGTAGLPLWSLVGNGASRVLRVEFLRRKGGGMVYTPMVSSTLEGSSFITMTGAPMITDVDSEWERVVIDEPADPVIKPRCFGRIGVETGGGGGT